MAKPKDRPSSVMMVYRTVTKTAEVHVYTSAGGLVDSFHIPTADYEMHIKLLRAFRIKTTT